MKEPYYCLVLSACKRLADKMSIEEVIRDLMFWGVDSNDARKAVAAALEI